MRKNDLNTEYEICVMCGSTTDTPISLPVTERKNYIEGLGELCERCKIRLAYDEQTSVSVTNRELIEILNSLDQK